MQIEVVISSGDGNWGEMEGTDREEIDPMIKAHRETEPWAKVKKPGITSMDSEILEVNGQLFYDCGCIGHDSAYKGIRDRSSTW